MSEREWQAWAEGDDPDASPPGIDPYPPDDFDPQIEESAPVQPDSA